MATESQRKATAKYDAEHTVQVKLKLNKEHDADIIEALNNASNKQGYIKKLIRRDIVEDMIKKTIDLQAEGKISGEQGYRLRQLAQEGIDISMGLIGRIDGFDRCIALTDAIRDGDNEQIQQLVDDTAEAEAELRRKAEEILAEQRKRGLV